jgi:hypothetical protein
MNTHRVYERVIDILKELPMPGKYESEERELQPHLKREISRALEAVGLMDYCHIKLSTGGLDRPRVDLLGTNFWPDIEISYQGEPLIAIEVKHTKSLPGALAATIGQCTIYKLKYPHTIGFILHRGPRNPDLCEYDDQFWTSMKEIDIPIVLRFQLPDWHQPGDAPRSDGSRQPCHRAVFSARHHTARPPSHR